MITKTTKKYILMILMLLLTLVFSVALSGCNAGSSINTTLTINDDLSGKRDMKIIINNDVFNEYFSGTITDLNNIITIYCPSSITYEYYESESSREYVFTLSFSSLLDYQSKVNNILGEESTIVIEVPESIWVNGIYVEESFESVDLLAWLSNALIENGYVSESNASMIFSDGSTEVIYNGQSNSSSSQIYVDQIEYINIDEINFFKDINNFDDYNLKVEFAIPSKYLDLKGEEIRAYFISLDDGFMNYTEETEDGYGSIFSFAKENISASEEEKFLKTIFGDEQVN